MDRIKYFINQLAFRLATRCIPKFQSSLDDKNVGVSSVVCHSRLDMFICSASSLMYHLGKSLPIYIVNDGTLTIADKKRLHKLFTVVIESNQIREKKWKKLLPLEHEFIKYRLDNDSPVTKLKYDANLLSPFSRTIYIDLDVLFLKKPELLVNWIASNSNINYHCTYPRKTVKSNLRSDADYSFRYILNKFVFPMATPSFNSGIVAIANKSVINFVKLNEIFAYFNSMGYSKSFMAEETALSILFANKNCKSLPTQSYICVARESEYLKISATDAKAIHFIHTTESRYISHALNQFKKTHFFRMRI